MLLYLLACHPAPSQDAYLLSGWNYSWETLSHRISLMDVGVEEDASLQLGFIGGPFSSGVSASDTPLYRMRFEKVESSDLWFLNGETELTIGPEAETETADTVATVDANAFPEVDGMVAILRGFRIATDVEEGEGYPTDTYAPSYGYTTAGFGFSLGEPTGSGMVDIPVSATVRWRPQDREDMNAAIPFAQTSVLVRYTLIGYKGELQRSSLGGEQSFPVANPDARSWSWTEQEPMKEKVAFTGEKPRTVTGWTSFDLGVNLTGDFAGTGDYVRAMGMEVVPTADDEKSWAGEATTTILTTSAIELTVLTASYSANLVRIGVSDAEVAHYLVEGSHPVGEAFTDDLL